jgi:ankyrin repeat protein
MLDSVHDISAIARAVSTGDTVMLQRLLEAGADANGFDEDGIPLVEASGENCEAFALLVLHGARVDLADGEGRTWLHRTSMSTDDDPRLRLLLGKLDVNGADRDGWTPLDLAASCGYATTSRLLVAARADPQRLTNAGLTAAGVAIVNGHAVLAGTLSEHTG